MARTANPIPTIRKVLALPKSVWDAVAEYRVAAELPTETETVRVLLLAALAAEKKKAPKP